MSRLIDADSYLKNFCNRFCSVKECTRTQKNDCCIAISLEAEPTAEAIESTKVMPGTMVVRCKNCKYWGTGVVGETEHVKCCEYGKYMVGENGYCVFGERK